jgi:N-methylhydantoinase A/oxoprolinase/acetone carboxylase beta subunit
LDVEASRTAFEEIRSTINQSMREQDAEAKEMTLDEIAYGFIQVANETMA